MASFGARRLHRLSAALLCCLAPCFEGLRRSLRARARGSKVKWQLPFDINNVLEDCGHGMLWMCTAAA